MKRIGLILCKWSAIACYCILTTVLGTEDWGLETSVYAQEEITITTYYPAPYGVYKQEGILGPAITETNCVPPLTTMVGRDPTNPDTLVLMNIGVPGNNPSGGNITIPALLQVGGIFQAPSDNTIPTTIHRAAIFGRADAGIAGEGTANGSTGVYGLATGNVHTWTETQKQEEGGTISIAHTDYPSGVMGESTNGIGVEGEGLTGVRGVANTQTTLDRYGVHGIGTVGVYGEALYTGTVSGAIGVKGYAKDVGGTVWYGMWAEAEKTAGGYGPYGLKAKGYYAIDAEAEQVGIYVKAGDSTGGGPGGGTIGIITHGTNYGIVANAYEGSGVTNSATAVYARGVQYGIDAKVYGKKDQNITAYAVHGDTTTYKGTGTAYAGYFKGKILATETFQDKWGDYGHLFYDIAELIPCGKDVEYGDIVIINPDKNREVIKCTDKNQITAGIISENPQISCGDREKARENEPEKNWHYLALAGQILVKADASYGEIKRGDLLTTSPTPGHAMKVKPIGEINGYPIYPQGCIVGKALEGLKEGKGKILVLVCLM